MKYIANLVILLTFLVPTSHAIQNLDRVVAVVNKDIISQTELDNFTKIITIEMAQNSDLPPPDVLQKQILNRMILDKIQMQLAEQVGIEVDSFAVSQTIQGIAKQQDKTVEEYKASLEKRGINFNDYRNIIKTDLTIQHLQNKEVHQNISLTKADIESYLSSPAGQDQSGTEYKISHILLLTPESPTPDALKKLHAQADDIVAKLKAGADFNKIAMSKSSGRQALKGGDLGWRTAGEIPTVFVNFVPLMQVGDIAGPISSASGLHIIKLQEKRTVSDDARTETKVRQILIKADNNNSSDEAKILLTHLRQQLLKGGDFAKLAMQKSQDTRTGTKGGDMGWVTDKLVPPKFYQTMSKLRNNEISEPFQTEEGWHLIQVLDRRSQLSSNEATWNKAREVLTMRKINEALETWAQRIRDEAQVDILL